MVDMNQLSMHQDRVVKYNFVPPIANLFELARYAERRTPAMQTPLSPAPTPPATWDAVIRARTDEAIRTCNGAAVINNQPSPDDEALRPKEEGDEKIIYIGDYVCRTAQILEQLFSGALGCQELKDAAARVTSRARNDSDGDDIKPTSKMLEKIRRLDKMLEITADFVRDIQELWEPSIRSDENTNKLPPFKVDTYEGLLKLNELIPETRSPQEPSPRMERPPRTQGRPIQPRQPQTPREAPPQRTRQVEQRRQSKQDPPSPNDDDSGSDGSDEEEPEAEEEDAFAKIDMEALKSRGKGNHTCPKGKKCTKGGIDKDGELIVFDRNSAFVQHCNKHRKPYRCNLDGCPNQPKKRRFARRDGLERHQRSVPHLTTPLQTSS